MRYSSLARKLPVIIPISLHQLYYPGLEGLAKFNNITFVPLVTEDTKRAEKKRTEEGKKIPWPILPEGTGHKEYLEAAKEAYKDQAIVVVAPQGQRQPVLLPFRGDPIRHIMNQSPKGKDVFVVPVGIEIPGVEDYGLHREYNLGKTFIVRFGSPLLGSDMKAVARQTNGITMSNQVYSALEQVVPPSYRLRPQGA